MSSRTAPELGKPVSPVRAYRCTLDLSQAEFAQLLGVTEQTVLALEQGTLAKLPAALLTLSDFEFDFLSYYNFRYALRQFYRPEWFSKLTTPLMESDWNLFLSEGFDGSLSKMSKLLVVPYRSVHRFNATGGEWATMMHVLNQLLPSAAAKRILS